MNIRRFLCISISILALAIVMSQNCLAFEVMVSLNTYRKSKVVNAVDRVNEFYADGVWFITKNTDFTDSELKRIFETLKGSQISEDNPDQTLSYDRYLDVMGKKPTGSFFYNETGGLPGGTLLSDAEIDAKYAHTGKKPILCLTRAYMGDWKKETDRCLANAKVDGIVCEPVREAIMEIKPGVHNGIPQLIDAVTAAGKKLFFLVHASPDGWSDADQAVILSNLNDWAPAAMASNNITIVYQNYDQDPGDATAEWLGSAESVKSAIAIAKANYNYTGGNTDTDTDTDTDTQDQCNTTQECKDKYGSSATDCLNSWSDQSVCMCGNQLCEDTGPQPIPDEPADQCNYTQECKDKYGSSATDCFNSRSDQSVCMCGNQPCE